MPTANAELEFDRLAKQWWWFTADHQAQVQNRVAWYWEILRRTGAYREFQATATRLFPVRNEPVPNGPGEYAASPQTLAADAAHSYGTYRAAVRALVYSHLPLGDSDPRRNWAELFFSDDNCACHLSWVELSESSRNQIQAIAPLFPRQDKPVSQYLFFITSASLERKESGEVIAYAYECRTNEHGREIRERIPERNSNNPVLLGRHPEVEILPEGIDRMDYIAILFHTHAGEAALQQFDAWKALEGSCPVWWSEEPREIVSRGTLKKRHGNVHPSNEQYYVQAWIPGGPFEEVRARFHTLLMPRERCKWLRQCQKIWELPKTIGSPGQSQEVTYPEYRGRPKELGKKSGELSLHVYKIGLAAFDLRDVERSFTAAGLLLPYLRERIKEPQISPVVVRNCLKAIKRRLNQIDQIYGIKSTR